ncbi:TatD family hydrolase [Chlamydia suis]|uniref:TatD family hydrolase n=1 Tax=Chlamydia suis TaxID=83559 RepID=UPI0009AF493A|nr:TatD family hydrolase [Chlamydia suis]MEB2690327.1 TatD family hydrolase [Chlamydia suis]QYC81956.1 TatD family hydrolase [Chlamydia suis]
MEIIDAHVHLSSEEFIEDFAEVHLRGKTAGVTRVVNVATTKTELHRSFAYAETYPSWLFYHAAGTPPQDAQDDIEEDFQEFCRAAEGGKLAAIGEVGLDYLFAVQEHEQERQKEVLRRYLGLALQHELPLVVHCRGAFADFFSILDHAYCVDERARPGMLHCFTGTYEEAKELLARDWYISISGIVTFKNAQGLRDLVKQIPLERLLVETDAPYLAPTPLRGKRNEPANILYTLTQIAEIKGLSLNELQEAVFANVQRWLRGS